MATLRTTICWTASICQPGISASLPTNFLRRTSHQSLTKHAAVVKFFWRQLLMTTCLTKTQIMIDVTRWMAFQSCQNVIGPSTRASDVFLNRQRFKTVTFLSLSLARLCAFALSQVNYCNGTRRGRSRVEEAQRKSRQETQAQKDSTRSKQRSSRGGGCRCASSFKFSTCAKTSAKYSCSIIFVCLW